MLYWLCETSHKSQFSHTCFLKQAPGLIWLLWIDYLGCSSLPSFFLFMTLSNSALISNRDAEIYSVWRAKWLTGQSIQSFDPRSQELPLFLYTKHKTKSNNQMITFWLRVLCTTCSYEWGDSRGHQSAEVESSPTSTRNLKSHSWIQCPLRLIFPRNASEIKDNEDMNCSFSSYSRFYCEQLSVLWD